MIGTEFDIHHPSISYLRVVDADTGEVLPDVVGCDVEEGWIERYARKEGRLQVTADGAALVTERLDHMAVRIEASPFAPSGPWHPWVPGRAIYGVAL